MTFKTEFELVIPYKGPQEQYFKGNMQLKLGGMIADSFEWKERIFTDPQPNIEDMKRWSLEIEAFPMDKWVEFKQKLHDYLHVTGWVSGAIIFKMIEELESYGTK